MVTRAELDALRQWDTPTICNGLELIVPDRRAIGFTTVPLAAARANLPPMVGVARTGLIRGQEPSRGELPSREDWYEYVEAADLPTIAVLQDIDHRPGFGAFWGEVQSAVHMAIGVLGCVTNGAYRDVEQLAPGFQILGAGVVPSHAHVHMLRMGDSVDVAGMRVLHGDVIHADSHGAVVVPAETVALLPAAIDLVMRREKVVLDLARAPGFSAARMREALRQAGEIH